jgi:hypothetical protein
MRDCPKLFEKDVNASRDDSNNSMIHLTSLEVLIGLLRPNMLEYRRGNSAFFLDIVVNAQLNS